jgi:SAM-dependent methyltransferase
MSFGTVAEDYDRLRSGPAEAAVDWLLPPGCQVAVDLGAGTGLLTRALARKVPRVVAVEPDERMAAVLRARSSGARSSGTPSCGPRSPGIDVVQGRGEEIPLPDASADGVFISSAWHWMDPERAPREIARVLRDGGRLGVIWTSRDRDTDWLREVDTFRRADPADAAGELDGQRGEPPRPRRREVRLPDDLFGSVEAADFRFTRRMTIDDLVGLLATYSGAITASPHERESRLARARALLEQRFPGAAEIDVPMRSHCFRADRADRAGPGDRDGRDGPGDPGASEPGGH